MKKHILWILTIMVFIVSYSDLTLAQYQRGSDTVYGANGKVFQYGYPIVNLAEPICKSAGYYDLWEGSYGCMTLQYGDALPGYKPTRCPSCINSGCCHCRSCCGIGGCTR